MKKKRMLRVATASVAMSALLMASAGPAAAQSLSDIPVIGEVLDDLVGGTPPGAPGGSDGDDGDDAAGSDAGDAPTATTTDADVPEAGLAGFTGTASATGLFVGIGLPSELAGPLQPLFEGLGIDGSAQDLAIALNIAETNAELRRAAAGGEVEGLADALIVNLLLGSGAADRPGSCQGAQTVNLPDDQTPVIRLTVADIDCSQDDVRAFAKAHVAGASINLGNLIDLAGADALRDGLDQLLEPVNEQLLGAINDACGDLLNPIFDGIGALPILGLPGAGATCDALELRVQNILNVDVPLLDVDLLPATSEVTEADGVVTATGEAGIANLQLAGLVCVESETPNTPLRFVSTATTDGETGSATATAPLTTARLCNNTPLAQILNATELLNRIEIAGQGAADLINVQPLTAGITEALGTLLVDTDTSLTSVANTTEDGAGAAAEARLEVLNLQLFRGIEPLATTPLGDITVTVRAASTTAGVNAAPVTPLVPAEGPVTPAAPAAPRAPLPHTGAGLAGVLGLAALGAATMLRRRED